jgi:hypothetical protein
MTDNTETQAATSKAPTHIAYHMKKTKSGESYRTRIGAAWAHKVGKGINIQLDGLVPLDGRITLFDASEKSE